MFTCLPSRRRALKQRHVFAADYDKAAHTASIWQATQLLERRGADIGSGLITRPSAHLLASFPPSLTSSPGSPEQPWLYLVMVLR